MAKAEPIHNPDRFEVDDLFEFQGRTMMRIIRQMTEEHRQSLVEECLRKIQIAQDSVCRPGFEACDSRGVTRFPNPYTVMKKYTYMYTALTGWSTDTDLEARENEKFQREGMSEEQKEAFRKKGWMQ